MSKRAYQKWNTPVPHHPDEFIDDDLPIRELTGDEKAVLDMFPEERKRLNSLREHVDLAQKFLNLARENIGADDSVMCRAHIKWAQEQLNLSLRV